MNQSHERRHNRNSDYDSQYFWVLLIVLTTCLPPCAIGYLNSVTRYDNNLSSLFPAFRARAPVVSWQGSTTVDATILLCDSSPFPSVPKSSPAGNPTRPLPKARLTQNKSGYERSRTGFPVECATTCYVMLF